MRMKRATVGPLGAASATAVAAAQNGVSGVPLTLSGGTLDTLRRVGVTSSGNDTANSFFIAGTNWSGQTVSETLIGANAGTVQSVLDYATVTSVVPSLNTAGTVSVGTTGVASSSWVMLDIYGLPTASMQFQTNGVVNYTLEQTLDNPNSSTNPMSVSGVRWLPSLDVVNLTADALSNYAYGVPVFCRVTLNSGTGSVIMSVAQSGGRVS